MNGNEKGDAKSRNIEESILKRFYETQRNEKENSTMKKLMATLTCTVIVLSLALTGCGASGGLASPTAQAPQAVQASPTPQAAQAVQASPTAPAPQAKKVLIEGRPSDSSSLDPMAVTENATWRATRQIYDTLVGFKEASFEPVPSLATSWTTSADGKVWTLSLAKGVKFHDGTDFDADAVVFNVMRWWDASNPYHLGKFPNVESFYGGFKGNPNSVIQDVKATDANTVVFTLTSVFPEFLFRLSDPTAGIISPAAIKKYADTIGKHPVGTGPFMFQEWLPNDSITLVKNPNYWKSGLPKLDRLIFKVIPDNTARLTALQSGEIDLMDGLSPSDAATVKGNGKLQLITRPAINAGFFWFNMTKAPFDNVKVRQAISMAINKKALIKAFYNDYAVPAEAILTPYSWAYNSKIQDYEYNPGAAKALLAEAGYRDGFSMDLLVRSESRPYFPDPLKIAQSMQADLAAIGIKANIVTSEGTTYSNKVYNGDFAMAAWGTGGNDPDPGLALDHYFDKIYAKTTPATNSARYVNDRVSELLSQAERILDTKQRAAMYQEAQQIIRDEAPILPMVHSNSLMAAASYVKNYIAFTDYFELYHNVDIVK